MSDFTPKGDPRGVYWCSTRCGKFHQQHGEFGDCELQHRMVLAGQDICVPWVISLVKQNAKLVPVNERNLEKIERQSMVIEEYKKSAALQVETIANQSAQLRELKHRITVLEARVGR